jgi:hypothetical protein
VKGKKAQTLKDYPFIIIYRRFIKGNLPKIMDKSRIHSCRPPGLRPVAEAAENRRQGF